MALEAAIRMLLLLLRVKRGRETWMSYGLHESAEVGTELAQVNSVDLVPPHAMGAAQDFQKVDAGDPEPRYS